jgi:ATP-binding protein involved in chromosome partitioning
MFKKLEVPILGIVENMSYLELPDGSRMDLFGEGGGQRLATSTETTYLGGIPIDQNVRIGGDTGKPIVISHPDSPVAKAFTELAEKIAQKVSVAAFGGNKSLPISIVE